MWAEVAKSLWDGFDSASSTDKANFVKKLKTRWRSMKDRFNRGLRKEEEQARSGAAAARTSTYKYTRLLQFLRPILGHEKHTAAPSNLFGHLERSFMNRHLSSHSHPTARAGMHHHLENRQPVHLVFPWPRPQVLLLSGIPDSISGPRTGR
ncbi:uncharacterized protein LOC143766541 [Ranitomeya variabilis]|uniref:uncharacterized protein LOC143766541 n=1 Tax=Ranitomeya variabilis TaxID=490064 RepID=UPI004056F2FD